MSIFQEFNDMSKDYLMLEKSFDIEMDEILYEYTYGVTLSDDILLLLEKGESEPEKTEEKPGKLERFKNTLIKIYNAIIRFIQDSIDAITNAFSRKQNLTPEEYMRSMTGTREINTDTKRITEEAHKKVLEGRKIVSAISRGTSVPAETVAKFCDSCASFTDRHTKRVVTGAMAAGIYAFSMKKINDIKKDGMMKGLSEVEKLRIKYQDPMATRVLKGMGQVTKVALGSISLFSACVLPGLYSDKRKKVKEDMKAQKIKDREEKKKNKYGNK